MLLYWTQEYFHLYVACSTEGSLENWTYLKNLKKEKNKKKKKKSGTLLNIKPVVTISTTELTLNTNHIVTAYKIYALCVILSRDSDYFYTGH
jgi:P2-related tail formation protein